MCLCFDVPLFSSNHYKKQIQYRYLFLLINIGLVVDINLASHVIFGLIKYAV